MSFRLTFSHILATWCYTGLLKPAPGTWGSLAALPFAWCIFVLGGPFALVAASVVFFALGVWATARETIGAADHDPSEIVIDEVVGQWIALLPVAFGAWAMQSDPLRLWPGIVSAFVLFRLFDIWKPGPVGWADARDDALGVMMDDVVAGVLAAVSVGLLAVIAHGVMA